MNELQFLNIFFDEADGTAEYTEAIDPGHNENAMPVNDDWFGDAVDKMLVNIDGKTVNESEANDTPSVEEKAATEAQKATEAKPEDDLPEHAREAARVLLAEAKKNGFDTVQAWHEAQLQEQARQQAREKQQTAEQKWEADTWRTLQAKYQKMYEDGEITFEQGEDALQKDFQLAKYQRQVQDKDFQMLQDRIDLDLRQAGEVNPDLKNVDNGSPLALARALAMSGLVKGDERSSAVANATALISGIISSAKQTAVAEYVAKQAQTQTETKPMRSASANHAPSSDRTQTTNSDPFDDLLGSMWRKVTNGNARRSNA